MRVVHLYHSGVLIETESIQVFIDVISDISHWIDYKKTIYFFVTHGHHDHWDSSIAKYQGDQVYYVISDDIHDFGQLRVLSVMPNRKYSVGQLEVETFESTDMGVSLLIHIENFVVFHAGDLNWWHWVNDDEDKQAEEAQNYKRIVKRLPPEHLDVAFIPCDSRLGEAMMWASDYFMSAKSVGHLIPIHFRAHFEVSEQLFKHFHSDVRVVKVTACDEVVLEL